MGPAHGSWPTSVMVRPRGRQHAGALLATPTTGPRRPTSSTPASSLTATMISSSGLGHLEPGLFRPSPSSVLAQHYYGRAEGCSGMRLKPVTAGGTAPA